MLASFYISGVVEAGCDEAGRGCLAGPVVASAVILGPNIEIPGLNDSKQLSEKQREHLREIILQKAESYAVAEVSPSEIDKINILNASIRAMHLALDKLPINPESIIVDGNRFKPYGSIKHACIVKGDGKYLSIAAASVLAKTTRDRIMTDLDEEFPYYLWKKNKGYPTAEHRDAIKKHGPCIHHRMSFNLIDRQLKLDF